MHYEKLGVGSNRGFQYNNLQLPHDHIMYFNFRIVNSLGFENILSSKPILTDYTPPDPTSCRYFHYLMKELCAYLYLHKHVSFSKIYFGCILPYKCVLLLVLNFKLTFNDKISRRGRNVTDESDFLETSV